MTDHSARQATWDANLKAVWHMTDDPDTSHIVDSTAEEHDGTKESANHPIEFADFIYKSQDLDGAQDYIDCGDIKSGIFDGVEDELTIEALINLDDVTDETIASKYNSSGIDHRTFVFYVAGGKLKGNAYIDGETLGYFVFESDDVVISASTDYYVAAVFDLSAKNIDLYVDEVEVASTLFESGNVPTVFEDTAQNFYIGAREDTHDRGGFVEGGVDEVRLSKGMRTAAWLLASYYSGNDSLLAYGEEETPYIFVSAPATSTSEALAPTIWIGIEVLAVTAEATSEALAPIFPHVEISAPTAIATSEALIPILPNVTIFGVTAVATSEAKVPVIRIRYNVAAATATATSEALVPTIQIGINISPPTATATSEALVPIVAAAVDIAAVTALSDSEALVPTILAVQNVDIEAVTPTTADGVALAPTITTTWTVDIAAPTATADSEALAPAISCGVNITAPVAQATSEALAPEVTLTGDALVVAVTATADSQAIAPTIELLTEILAITATADSQAYAATIEITKGIEILAAVATADSQAYAVSILAQKNVNILALPALATSLALPSVYVGRDLIGLTFTRPVYDALSFTRKVWDAKTFTK